MNSLPLPGSASPPLASHSDALQLLGRCGQMSLRGQFALEQAVFEGKGGLEAPSAMIVYSSGGPWDQSPLGLLSWVLRRA